jgi:hypothetical protein
MKNQHCSQYPAVFAKLQPVTSKQLVLEVFKACKALLGTVVEPAS